MALVLALTALSGQAAGAAAALDAQQLRGRQIYLEGTSAAGYGISATMPGAAAPVPGEMVPCAACHGEDGKGKPDDTGVAPPDITWEAMVGRPHEHASGRRHPPFDEAAVGRAITDGLDPAGQELGSAMPRYSLGRSDLADLLAYLRHIEIGGDQSGALPTLRVGTLLPGSGRDGGPGEAMRQLLEAYLESLNRAGGIAGRRVELVVGEYLSDSTYGVWRARDLLDGGELIALLAPYVGGIEGQIADLARERKVPVVGPVTSFVPPGAGENPYVFYLAPGLNEQATVLAHFAAASGQEAMIRALVLYPDTPPIERAAQTISNLGRAAGWDLVRALPYRADRFPAGEIVAQSAGQGMQAVFFLGGGPELNALAEAAAAAAWTPYLFLPSLFVGNAASQLPALFQGRVFVAVPSSAADLDPDALQRFRALHEQAGLSAAYPALRIAAYSAAVVLAEALQRLGGSPSRQALTEELGRLKGFEPGMVPAISFEEGRRMGPAGAWVLPLDLSGRQPDQAGTWIEFAPPAREP